MTIYLACTIAGHILAELSCTRAGTLGGAHTLQQTGFTFILRHHKMLWAFTPLVSPLPFDYSQGGIVSVALSLGFIGSYFLERNNRRVTPGCR